MTPRTVLSLTGTDRIDFLQGLITNAVPTEGQIAYAALLTPQGKYIADFFVLAEADRLLIDVASDFAAPLAQRLGMYRLRADVQIETTDIIVSRGTGEPPDRALPDPRHPAMGWRLYAEADLSDDTDWTALRVRHGIPASGIELTPETYILEAGFERLHGVDFRKGCFVGQEIVARMKHKTTLRKGLARVAITGNPKPGPISTGDGREAGTLHSISGTEGLAHLRFDRASSEMRAGDATLRLIAALPDLD